MSPNVHIQMQWPPVGIEAVGWDRRALVMSAVLAASYYSANIAMVAKDQKVGLVGRGVSHRQGQECVGCDEFMSCVEGMDGNGWEASKVLRVHTTCHTASRGGGVFLL